MNCGFGRELLGEFGASPKNSPGMMGLYQRILGLSQNYPRINPLTAGNRGTTIGEQKVKLCCITRPLVKESTLLFEDHNSRKRRRKHFYLQG